ncbi:MAG TPA: hypothetical protein VEU09_04340 [Candidatus Binatia bacterium]|nr:hypothetical protein [Candidatus Binatia bacterium]
MEPTRFHHRIALLLAVFALALGPPRAWAEAESADSSAEPAFQFECSGTYASWYSFQGFDYSNRKPVFQPEVKASLKALSVGVWGNLDQVSQMMNEVDVTLRYGWEGKRASGGIGYVNLQYPNRVDWSPSQEIFAEGELEGPIQTSATVHWDVESGGGPYGALGVGREIAKSAIPIGLGVKLYAQEHYYGMSGISALETRASIHRSWAGVEWEPAISRLWTWENGDFRGSNAVSPGWLISLSFSPP